MCCLPTGGLILLVLFLVKVLKRVKHLGHYDDRNVMISGTHTHSAPGGFLMHLLFDITTMGFIKESFDGLVEGITLVRLNPI